MGMRTSGMPQAPHRRFWNAKRPKTIERFLAKLRPAGDCLIFDGTRTIRGYGIVTISYDNGAERYSILAHRFAMALHLDRDLPDDLLVCHRCNNPPCCNPDHLYLGTLLDDMADAAAAGMAVWIARPTELFGGAGGRRGVAHPAARFTAAQREEAIRLRYVERWTLAHISDHLGPSHDTLWRWFADYRRAVDAAERQPPPC